MGEVIPEEVTTMGKDFRKYVANRLIGKKGTIKQLKDKADLEAEKTVSAFFREQIGLDYYVWPQAQINPDGPTNRVVLDAKKIRIVRIDQVELDTKNHELVKGSEIEISLDSF